MLESRPVEGGQFRVEQVVDADAEAGDPTVVVRPAVFTVYRFRFAGRPMSEASESSLFVVTVVAPPGRSRWCSRYFPALKEDPTRTPIRPRLPALPADEAPSAPEPARVPDAQPDAVLDPQREPERLGRGPLLTARRSRATGTPTETASAGALAGRASPWASTPCVDRHDEAVLAGPTAGMAW